MHAYPRPRAVIALGNDHATEFSIPAQEENYIRKSSKMVCGTAGLLGNIFAA